uniref:hypothetical protein n=1 Tax=Porodaedalea mongolica TaxID=2651638 RepID=UPI0021ABDBF0|nr:hypothetical protein NYK79_mgp19 [Porodaedalea mongolica]UUA03971.1 hypothetical protein [Porodaedalea mongolica]WCF76738.1 hypothetical protein [Porodaedalea mongolica]
MGVITKQQYVNHFSSLISYASKQNINNSILTVYKDELLNSEQNFYNFLHNRIIYMNNTYSVLVLDHKTDSFVRLSYKAKNLLELQQANLRHKEELNNKLANNNLLTEHSQTLEDCNSLQDLLRSVYIFQIEKIKTNVFIVNSIVKEHPQLDNTFMYWKYFELFTFRFKYSDNEDAIFDIIPVNTKIKSANFIYSQYNCDEKYQSLLFFSH